MTLHLVENEPSLLTINERREKALAGMEIIIRRMTQVAPRGDLVLADYSERELAAALLAYLEGRPTVVET